MSELPAMPARASHETQRFWDATAQGRIDLARCRSCDLIPYPPRGVCPDCQGLDMVWESMSGRGTVYSYSVTRAGGGRAWREHLPFVVAYVQLEEGPMLMTNIVDCDPESVEVGMAVTAVFDVTGEAMSVVRFTPEQQ